MTEIFLLVIAGLVLFLLAVNKLSRTLKSALGENARYWIAKFTASSFSSLLVGVVVTILLDSSSAVIIITIVLINAKLVTVKQAMGIVLGANIGTTAGSQVIALNIGKYAPLFMLAGFALSALSGTGRIKETGSVILYFGMLFFGLFIIENAVEPLKNDPIFTEWLKKTEDPVTGSLAGAFVTLVIQSSSATVGMVMVLAKKGLLSVGGGIAVMLGAELGTCSDTLIATIRGSRDALKIGIFHLSFNLVSIVVALLLFYPFVSLVLFISNNAPIGRIIANAHVIFNVCSVLAFIWFIPLFEKLLNRLLPERSR